MNRCGGSEGGMHGSDVSAEVELAKLRVELLETQAQLSALRDERRLEEAHRQQLVAIVEASRDAIWSWTPDLIITSWNAEAERLFQYRPEEIVGKSLMTLVPPERVDQAKIAIARLVHGGWYDQYGTIRVRKDGVHVPVELTVSPIRDADGTVKGIATACRDITARQRFESA